MSDKFKVVREGTWELPYPDAHPDFENATVLLDADEAMASIKETDDALLEANFIPTAGEVLEGFLLALKHLGYETEERINVISFAGNLTKDLKEMRDTAINTSDGRGSEDYDQRSEPAA